METTRKTRLFLPLYSSIIYIIDTSNLTDHLGLLNILPVSLMRKKLSSILYTHTLLPSNEKGMVRDDLLCGDISLISMILDLIPVSYVSNSRPTPVYMKWWRSLNRRQFHENINEECQRADWKGHKKLCKKVWGTELAEQRPFNASNVYPIKSIQIVSIV